MVRSRWCMSFRGASIWDFHGLSSRFFMVYQVCMRFHGAFVVMYAFSWCFHGTFTMDVCGAFVVVYARSWCFHLRDAFAVLP